MPFNSFYTSQPEQDLMPINSIYVQKVDRHDDDDDDDDVDDDDEGTRYPISSQKAFTFPRIFALVWRLAKEPTVRNPMSRP